jgi:mannose-6-phosphate isomerase-like protein (cupin superfamily)
MICRHYTEGQRINVADLNEITVLVDRSQTTLTEVGWNKWKPGLDGPPHSHDRKEQIFYVTDGHGTVVVGGEKFSVKPGDLIYVPPCVVHQTITQGGEPLCYFLFNAFLGADKEGHASFADHIDKVKNVRRKQAESGSADADGTARTGPGIPGKHIGDIRKGKVFDFGSNTTIPLLQRRDTNRAEVTLVTWPKGNKGVMVAHKEKEQTFLVCTRAPISMTRVATTTLWPWVAGRALPKEDSARVGADRTGAAENLGHIRQPAVRFAADSQSRAATAVLPRRRARKTSGTRLAKARLC